MQSTDAITNADSLTMTLRGDTDLRTRLDNEIDEAFSFGGRLAERGHHLAFDVCALTGRVCARLTDEHGKLLHRLSAPELWDLLREEGQR